MFKFASAVLMLSAKFAAMRVATNSSLGIDNFCFVKRYLLALIFCCVQFVWKTTSNITAHVPMIPESPNT